MTGLQLQQDQLVVEVELTVSAKCLVDRDYLSKSDPMCIVYVQNYNSEAWTEYARTERLFNTLNPEFSTKIVMGYRFEEIQKLKFMFYDIDSKSTVLEDHDFLGEAICTLGQIVSSGNFVTPLNYLKRKDRGQLCVRAEEVGSLKEEVSFLIGGQELKNSSFCSKPHAFLEIYKETDKLVYRSTFIKNNCNPTWPKFNIPMRALRTKEGKDEKLLLKTWNYNKNGRHKLIGEISVTTQEFIKNSPQNFSLVDKKGGKPAGKLVVMEAVVTKTYSFLDYIMSGTQLNCTIAIDFTASNGNPNAVGSLHYISPFPTLYEQALQSVVTIIQDYDSDKQFPVLGFGAKVPPTGVVSHEFYVNMTPNPFCARVEGVLEAYRRCLLSVQLHGPTNFAPVINHVKRFASTYQNGDHYFILLILTDGAICDMFDTKKAIIKSSHLPISIIIVGIGGADFSSMNELDSDSGRLHLDDLYASRDIVQFVPFRDFLNCPDPLHASSELARALLGEVPTQLVGFMKSKNIKPKGTVT